MRPLCSEIRGWHETADSALYFMTYPFICPRLEKQEQTIWIYPDQAKIRVNRCKSVSNTMENNTGMIWKAQSKDTDFADLHGLC